MRYRYGITSLIDLEISRKIQKMFQNFHENFQSSFHARLKTPSLSIYKVATSAYTVSIQKSSEECARISVLTTKLILSRK